MSNIPAAAVMYLAQTPVPGSRKILLGCYLVLVAAMIMGTRKGYWRGPLRQLSPTIALIIAVAAAWLGGSQFGHAVLKSTLVPWLLRGVLGMVLLAAIVFLIAFAALWRFGRSRLTNNLGETDSPVLGAFIGCWTAILWCSAGFALLCAAASAGEVWLLKSPNNNGGIVTSAFSHLSRVKNSLALVRGLGWLQTWNPIPEKTRRSLEKATRVLSSPETRRQLSRIQDVRAIATHPAFYPLRENEEIRRLALEDHDIEGLLAHPLILKMFADDDFQALLAGIDIEAILDSAIEAAEKKRSQKKTPKETSTPETAPEETPSTEK